MVMKMNRRILMSLVLASSMVVGVPQSSSVSSATETKPRRQHVVVIKKPIKQRVLTVRQRASRSANRLGWNRRQFSCLDRLWNRESHWKHTAKNSRSGAYGIPQALPGNKMKSAGVDWKTNPNTQVAWGLMYIKKRYGNPCSALQHHLRHGWY